MDLVLLGAVAVVVGGVASIAGFGIGSVLTPLVGVQRGVKLAVALVAIPHFAATALRAWRLRAHVDRPTLLRFGIASALGGLAGALLHGRANDRALATVLGALLVFVGIMSAAGLLPRLEFGRGAASAGVLSGGLGGLVGNQGGIRSAALVPFGLRKEAFVATAIGVLVDVARLPVYLATQGAEIARAWPVVAVATTGTIVGTLAGERVLRRVPERVFRLTLSFLILALGLALLAGTARS